MKAINKGLVALGAVSVLAAPSAIAGTLIVDGSPLTQSFSGATIGPAGIASSPNSVSVTQTVLFPKFLETPGETELMSVILTTNSVFSTTLSFTNNSGDAVQFSATTNAIQTASTPLGVSDPFASSTTQLQNTFDPMFVGPNGANLQQTVSTNVIPLEANGLINQTAGPGSGLAEFVSATAGDTIEITVTTLFTVSNTNAQAVVGSTMIPGFPFPIPVFGPVDESDIVWDWSFVKSDEVLQLNYVFEETPVIPVPGSAALLALGLAGFGFRLRAKAGKKAA